MDASPLMRHGCRRIEQRPKNVAIVVLANKMAHAIRALPAHQRAADTALDHARPALWQSSRTRVSVTIGEAIRQSLNRRWGNTRFASLTSTVSRLRSRLRLAQAMQKLCWRED